MIEVIGGTYREVVDDPGCDRVLGSGLRAARLLGNAVATFHTSAGNEALTRTALQSLLGNRWTATDRPHQVTFRYRTPVSSSHAYGVVRSATPRRIDVDSGNDAVVFGMVEGPVDVVGARRLVIDPQGSMSVNDIASQRAEGVCVCLNARELRRFTSPGTLAARADELRKQTGCAVVVVKCGAHGAYAVDQTGRHFTPAIVTARVWPVGSGDSFTAAFAADWLSGAPVPEALASASRTAAVECEAAPMSVADAPAPDLTWSSGPATVDEPPVVYLAAAFETTSQRWLLDEVRTALEDIGIRALSPLHDIGIVGPEPAEHVKRDLDEVRAADAVLVLSDIAGRGTFVEAGVALDTDTPVVVLAERLAEWQHTVLRGAGALFCRDLSTCVYQAAWTALNAAYPP